MATTVETIRRFFEEYGWEVDYDSHTQTWLTGFEGDAGHFNMMVHLTPDWIYFIISPFVAAPTNGICASKLYLHLLRVNHAVNLAKFSIDGDGDVVMTVELPTENLDFSEFTDGLHALSYYADLHISDIKGIASDPNHEVEELGEEIEIWEPGGGRGAPN